MTAPALTIEEQLAAFRASAMGGMSPPAMRRAIEESIREGLASYDPAQDAIRVTADAKRLAQWVERR